MPKIQGTEVCKEIHKTSEVRVIMLTMKGEEIDRIIGLELGSDDDIVKPYRVREIKAHIKQVVTILLDNAFKFTPKDGSGRISLQVEVKADKTLINVSDNGQGIKPEDLPHVFDRFYTADRARTGKATGLGLSIAKENLKRMNGDITATSEEGKGSLFTITLNS
jgi:signal transduction histidine kinase